MSALRDPGEPQIRASQPRASVFVAANAGSGKTSTLVKRVARLLLDGARPEAILCVTYTKAAAAEMQRRLFEDLGAWAVAPDADLQKALAAIDEAVRPLSQARALFARALETPGGLKIQTLHAFCEKLLRRFPLEAGVSPGFKVLDDVAAAEVSARAREGVNDAALARPDGLLAAAYAHFSVQLDWQRFNEMFAAFEARRSAIAAHLEDCERSGGFVRQAWRMCGFGEPTPPEEIEADALAGLRFRWNDWKKAAEALSRSNRVTDQELGAAMGAVTLGSRYADISAPFFTDSGEPRRQLGTSAVERRVKAWLADEQARHVETRRRLAAATVARDTAYALTLASAYAALYEGEKSERGALDFTDLIARAGALLGERADAAWVLYKLDGGLTHILIDEAQDTAPEQWDIVRALTEEFFVGLGSSSLIRTVFAVGDPKQSIFSFQGARPERLAVETQRFGELAGAAGIGFEEVKLQESWRSAPEILRFVDQVFTDPQARTGLSPMVGGNVEALPPVHIARRPPGGCVELWPLAESVDGEDPDVWAPVDAEPPTSAVKLLAGRIARSVAAMVARGDGVRDRDSGEMRPCAFGDVLILVRRRSALFQEIIRALKKEGAPVAGADRLKLSEHGVFEDLMALGRFTRFPGDDLALAGLLRGPFCDLDEDSLFDLAYERGGRLWPALLRRAAERPQWAAAADILVWARSEAERAAPFDFYSRFLGRLDADGRSMRQRLLTRMGAEGEEALDAFLAQALEAEGRGCRELETVLDALAASEIEIKREPELARTGPGEVRVMTVHGAKGLEAPIVILPDTTTRATAQQAGPLLETDGGGFLWAPRKAEDCAASALAREARERAVEQEAARLLYVALTRARDRLIVCGVQSRTLFERSWYDFVSRAFGEIHTRPFALEGGGEGRRYGVAPTPCAPGAEAAAAAPPLPAWTRGLAPADAPVSRYASPSTLGEGSATPASSPLAAAGGLGRYRRGELIHRLLQLLPDVAPERRSEAARRLLARERDLGDDQRAEMARAALGVLEDPRFAAVFGPGSRAEAALAGVAERLPAGLAVSGRVDRLLVEAERVLVVDFKTNRPAPMRIEDADDAYVTQMALYWALLGEIYPDRAIEAALVWTDGPRLMPVPETLMRDALTRLTGD
jgi:ATP-dependent helicase/nuclease subunit A